MTNNQALIEALKRSDSLVLKKVYEENRNGFILFSKRYLLSEDEVLDVYQDAIIALCENAKKGKLDTLQSSVSTYLFSIGKFMIFTILKKKNQTILKEDFIEDAQDFDWYEIEVDEEIKILQKSFEMLGEQCKKVLTLFYYEEKKLDEIQVILNYTNKDVLKSQKSRCLKQLKDLAVSKK